MLYKDALVRRIAPHVESLPVRLALRLPEGTRLGARDPEVVLAFSQWSSLASLVAGRIGALACDVVEGRVKLEGAMRPAMQAAASLLSQAGAARGGEYRPQAAWMQGLARLRSWASHSRAHDARQVQFHYDVGDAFYALWLDPRRVYSCAYFRTPDLTLAQAQEAKLDHICRKLMLRPGERFLDIGAGWGALLLWAAQHYGVRAQGITLSRNQHAHVNRLIEAQGLTDRVRIDLMDFRDLDESVSYDKIASVGMFEHVGCAQMDAYFTKIQRLLRPGGLVMNHGITAGRICPGQVDPGLSAFIERYIFPGGELLPAWEVMQHQADAGLEVVDVENLRPHYARTLWAWSDRLEAKLQEASRALVASAGAASAPRILRAYRLYLAGCAMAFERGWVSLHQVLATRPTGEVDSGVIRGAQSDYPFSRDHLHTEASMLYKFKSKASGDLIMLEPNGRRMLEIIGKTPGAQGIIEVHQMAAAVAALEGAATQDEAQRQAEADEARRHGHDLQTQEAITLRHRAAPLIEMLRRCEQASADIVWGV
jgi:cyclopropane-fatty-acyl-phospholipid synthase